jgi:hypothetical protein
MNDETAEKSAMTDKLNILSINSEKEEVKDC